MSDKTGGPAFPLAAGTGDPRDGVYCQNGMTLLDWFAGQALAGMVADSGGYSYVGAATDAYRYAEAMLAEKARREATGKDGLQVADHSPDAGKMARLEEETRELVGALSSLIRNLNDPVGIVFGMACQNARSILAKHQTHKKEVGHE